MNLDPHTTEQELDRVLLSFLNENIRPDFINKVDAKYLYQARTALSQLILREKIKGLKKLLSKQYFAQGYGYDHGQVVDVLEIEDKIAELESKLGG